MNLIDLSMFGSMTKLKFSGKTKPPPKKNQEQTALNPKQPELFKNDIFNTYYEEGCSNDLVMNEQSNDDDNDDDDETEARDKFETSNTTFYKVLRQSYYDEHMNQLKNFQKNDGLKSSTRRVKKPIKPLAERKLIISSPINAVKVLSIDANMLKKSCSLDNLLSKTSFEAQWDALQRMMDTSPTQSSISSLEDAPSPFLPRLCTACGDCHYPSQNDIVSFSRNNEDEDSSNLRTMKYLSKSHSIEAFFNLEKLTVVNFAKVIY
ncbi:hypothetical protein ABEB36_007560 [Hypothenemus hampei]|uniref:Uncharacterized protein n=1 Tax=Hypothenemus hampei TaxID=57062 RepID=A0ABD1EUF6_HYPHA